MSRSVGKAEIAAKVAQILGFGRSQTPYKLVTALVEHLKKCILDEGRVSISRFGRFYTLTKKQRLGRNPQTGERMKLPGRILVKWKPSPLLKSLIGSD